MARRVQQVTERVRRFREHQAEQDQRAREELLAREQEALPPDVRARLETDPLYFIESTLHVAHIDGDAIIPFTLTDSQRVVGAELKRGLDAGEPVRLVILKSRRQLISSFCQAVCYWRTSTRRYTNGLVVADVNDRTETIFKSVETYYRLDERYAMGARPRTVASNKRELVFGNPDRKTRDLDQGLMSGLRVTSAEAKEPGMGHTLHVVHASEAAYYADQAVWRTVGIALHKGPGSIAMMESTANGQSGLFYDTYRKAKRGHGASDNRHRGENEWTAIFLAWWMDRRNRAVLTPEEYSRFDYKDRDERLLAEKWKLSPEQVVWRRRVIASPDCFKPGVAPEDVFRQEYPADDDEAFLVSGKHFFLLGKVKEMEESERGTKEPTWTGEIVQDGPSLEDRGPGNRLPVKPKFETDPGGALMMWKEPKKGTPYIVAVDPAEGLTSGDPSVILVLDRARTEFVAAWHGTHVSARELAWKAGLIGWFYGTCLLVVEHNNHGLTTIEELKRIMYPRLWNHLDVTHEGSPPTDRVGWLTTPATRQYALLNLESEIRSSLLKFPWSEFYEQCRHFIHPAKTGGANASGYTKGPRAEEGFHDDVVLCAAIALAVHQHAGLVKVDHPALHGTGDPAMMAKLVPVDPKLKVGEVFTKQKRRVKKNSLWGY